jgi:peptidoglycan/LPS O-acetylase OafA/YrhL
MSASVPVVAEQRRNAIARAQPASGGPASSIRKFFWLDLLDNRYPALHGMRVLAIVLVVQFHVTQYSQEDPVLAFDPAWAELSHYFFFGMDLFFVLSGFLIGSILIRSIESSGSQHVRRFYLRRAFRTFPSYYLVLTCFYLGRLFYWHDPPRQNVLLEYAYLTDYLDLDHAVMPYAWSLAVEEKFYLLVPLLFFLLPKLRTDRVRIVMLIVMWESALVVRLAILQSHPGWTLSNFAKAVYFTSHARYDTLVAGIIMAYVQHRWREPIARWLQGRGARAILRAVIAACLVPLLAPRLYGEKHQLLVRAFNWGTETTTMYFALILLVLNGPDGWLRRFLSAKAFRQLATLGYGVYLVHVPSFFWPVGPLARWLRVSRGWSMGAVWPTALVMLLAVSFLGAYGLHLLVEKPSLRLRDRVAG